MVMEYSTSIVPIYYKGWVMQPSFDGWFYVNSRLDVSEPKVKRFDCEGCAMDWVDREIDKERL